jgi:hypothetical protein
MSFTEIAINMFPYWIAGALVMLAVYKSRYKHLLRVEKKPVIKWIAFLAILTAYRIVLFKLLAGTGLLDNVGAGASLIPWQATLTVFWEDMCHGLPLAILAISLGNDKKWKKVIQWSAMVLVMTYFGLGHVYQGYFVAFLLSFYVPFTVKKGQEVGFGTIMICHTLYDLATILTVQNFLR